MARLAVLENMGEETMIVFAPEEVKYTVTVFTDIDCPYCARLHREVKELNDNGIKVRYLAFPRAGIPSSSYDKTVSVWCCGRYATSDYRRQIRQSCRAKRVRKSGG